jgi:hypothetical protein
LILTEAQTKLIHSRKNCPAGPQKHPFQDMSVLGSVLKKSSENHGDLTAKTSKKRDLKSGAYL